MCDQTEVLYTTGDVVWVKLGPVWWPGQVQDYDTLPEEITSNLRKRPIAVVKFFQEDSFEYVKNLDHIYHYNCRKKEEFIKKGLDMVRSSNSRDVPSNMKMFPEDIVMAEHITGGDPNILNNDIYAPEQKSDYSDLFGTKKSIGKKVKLELKKERNSWKPRKLSTTPLKNTRRSLPVLPSTIPRPITHPRFLTKALEGKSDHEIRIRCQISAPRDFEEKSPVKNYQCHLCEFQTCRLNVIVLHNKSHSASFIEAQNAIRAQLKSRERNISPTISCFNDQTPKTVTSRGRVKSLPKKLMDYTDEPPAKVFKEKLYNKHSEDNLESPCKSTSPKSLSKSAKKTKDNFEKTPIKRPLFGKRKTAKEKAELVAKQKEENEAMKETLLKDWDDDDLFQEEVELEQLKQALESTVSSVEFEDSNNSEVDDAVHINTVEDTINKEKVKSPDNSSTTNFNNSDIKAKVFEFDDSEDSLPVTNFRLKNQREKFTDDKFKKPKPPKPKIVSKLKSSLLSPSPSLRQESDKETEEFNKAFNSLLEETSVPVLPEIPKTSISFCTSSDQISDQTSDISSSTDLVKSFSNAENADDEVNDEERQQSKSDSEYISSDLKLECTSSDSEEQVSEPVMVSHNTEKIQITEEQKNLNKVSASDPRVEIGSDLIISGVATTKNDNYKSLNSVPSGNETSSLKEDSSTTEITSTCDIAKSYNDKPENNTSDRDELTLKMECKEEESTLTKTDNIDDVLNDSCFHIDNSSINLEEDNKTEKFKIECVEKANQLEISKNTEQDQETSTHLTSKRIRDDTGSKIIVSDSLSNDNTNLAEHEDLQALVISNESIYQSSQAINTLSSSDIRNAIQLESVEASVSVSNVKEEISDEKVIKQTSMETGDGKSMQLTKTSTTMQTASVGNLVNVQLIMPDDTLSNSNALNIDSQPLVSTDVKIEMAQTGKAENQSLSQNLQDMELDINSMPVIIGGEDFVQPEQPKQSLVSIQPKYSDSIVISPKVTQSPSKSEGVIMHLGDPSTSNQHLQPLMAIPSKSVKSGSRGRSQKSTSKTIKLPAGTLKNLGNLQKGGNQQVLILKTSSSGQDKSDKSTIQKPCSMFQHGNKILIVNNAQMSGQNKIKLNPQQQQLLTGGKLAPGTRVITSKVVATTSSQATESPSKMSFSKSPSKSTQKLVFSKGGLLTNAPNSVIINRKLSNVQGAHTITTSKGQTLITHNLLNTKGGLILPSSSQNATSGAKTTAIITSQALTTSKGMILSPITSKGGTIISGNQKLRIVSSSKAPLSATRLLVQNSQGKLKVDPQHKSQQVKLISGLRGQSSGNAILIQTSQGLIAKSISSSTATTAATQSTIRATQIGKTVMTTIPTQAKIRALPVQQSQVLQQPITVQQTSSAKKATMQKMKQNPNILQKSQRKSVPRGSKSTGNRLISPAVSLPEPIILSPATSLPGVGQPTLVQGSLPQTSDGLVYLTVDETGNYRQIDNKSMISFEGNPETPRTIFIPADSQTQDMSNIFLAIDDAGNIVNITQPSSSKTLTTENAVPTQDILAKALANTQVLQQETIIPDMDVSAALASSSMDTTILSSNSYSEQANYPAPSLSHSVLETSLTLNQPIMTPLEVPSAVSPNIGHMSTISSNFISSNLIAKQKHVHPSMPLLTEESLANQTGNEPVYLLDSSNNIIPATSGSHISFQLTLDDNKVIMTGTDNAALPSTYQVVPGDLLATQIVDPRDTQKLEKIKSETLQNPDENLTFSILSQGSREQSETTETVKQSIILREALEGPQASLKSDQFLSSVEEMSQGHNHLENFNSSQEEIVQQGNLENPSLSDRDSEQVNDSSNSQDTSQQAQEEIHSLKRNLGEEETVTSSSDLENESKRMRIEER